MTDGYRTRRGLCYYCQRRVVLTQGGLVPRHYEGRPSIHSPECPGSGGIPAVEKKSAGKLSFTQKSALVAIANGEYPVEQWRVTESLYRRGLVDRSTYTPGNPKLTAAGRSAFDRLEGNKLTSGQARNKLPAMPKTSTEASRKRKIRKAYINYRLELADSSQKEVAEIAKTTPATVSRVIAGIREQGEVTERVWSALRDCAKTPIKDLQDPPEMPEAVLPRAR